MITDFKKYENHKIFNSLKNIIEEVNKEFYNDIFYARYNSFKDEITIELIDKYYTLYKIKIREQKIQLTNQSDSLIKSYNIDNYNKIFKYIKNTLVYSYLCYQYSEYFIKTKYYDIDWFIEEILKDKFNKDKFINDLENRRLPKSITLKYKYFLDAKDFDLL